jgi:DNA-binding LacI/PurR family transcriptional regulator
MTGSDDLELENKPLYMRILGDLQEQIRTGQYMPEQQLPTEVELAEQYGVSRITSKRALIELEREGLIYRKRGSGSYVKQPEDIHPKGEAGVQSTQPIISMILPYMATSELDYIKGAHDYLDSKGYYLSIHNSNWKKDKEREILTKVPKSGPSGIILYPISTISNIDVIHAVHMNDYPIVTIDQYFDSLPVSSVVSDNFDGGYIAAKRLIELGHERIAYVSSVGVEYRSSVRDRYMGYCKALKEHHISIDTDIMVTDFYEEAYSSNTTAFYRSLLTKLMDMDVTALQIEHDHLAVDLLKSCMEMGIQVPEQLSLTGFDDHDIARHVEIPVTSVAQDYYTIGYEAAKIIVHRIEQGDPEHHKIKVPVRWIERQSTGQRLHSIT